MPINDFHVQLATAFPPVQAVPSRKGTTFRADIQTDDGRKPAFLKLLKTEDIAREALCAVLARKLHLPMLQPYYVQVDPSTIEGRLAGNLEGVAFGLQQDYFLHQRTLNEQIYERVLSWPEALPCAVFDEWIFNRDRLPKNLIFAENGVYWLIDHDETLPNYAAADEVAGSQILQLLARDRSEFQRYELRKKAMFIIEQYKAINWHEIYELVCPGVLTGGQDIYTRYIKFLRERTSYMEDVLSRSLQLRQRELNLADKKDAGNAKGLNR